MSNQQEPRPVYRHIVVRRKDFIEKVASTEDFRRLRQQLDAGVPVDADLKHLVVEDTIQRTMRKVMGWNKHGDRKLEGTDDGLHGDLVMAEADNMAEREDDGTLRYKRQQGVIVARLTGNKVPGGNPDWDEPLPVNPTMLTHPGFEDAEDADKSFLDAAVELQGQFETFSDRLFLLVPEDMRSGCTLVTVVYTPVTSMPREDRGLSLFCEFHQTTRLGRVDTEGFDVYSEIGEYPITPPGSMDLNLMMRTVDQVMAVSGGSGR